MAIDFAAVASTAETLASTLSKITSLANRIESSSVNGVALHPDTIADLKTNAATLNTEYNANRDAFQAAKTP